MPPDAIVAFVAGIGSILGTGWTLRKIHRQEREDCERRIREVREAYDTGIEKGLTLGRPADRSDQSS